jgi:hypothetical protein
MFPAGGLAWRSICLVIKGFHLISISGAPCEKVEMNENFRPEISLTVFAPPSC